MHLSKKFVIVLSFSLLAAACGNSGDTKSGSKDSAASTSTTSPAATAASDKGLELIGASDCTTCHRINKEDNGVTTGPAYSEVAAKYSPAADTTVNRIVKKIITGGSGIWGTTPMTPHAALKEDDIRTMVKYILSLKK
ncbi:MAG TPA: c-type cytochrome [Puia sp.]|jgi:cytochrome c|nr:c-type cytochrome [Puia sp.]